MKRRMQKRKFLIFSMICLLLCSLCAGASALEAHAAQSWLERFALALESMEPVNDPARTEDPARPGEYLFEYAFGTVTCSGLQRPTAETIRQIDVRTSQVTDCRGLRVGDSLAKLPGALAAEGAGGRLYVLDASEENLCWSWAYTGESGVYGVEYIAYGADADNAAQMTEYMLTYVISDGAVSAIRMRMAEATQAQALDGVRTAAEIASRQQGETAAFANTQPMFAPQDMTLAGVRALGAEVASLVARIGEPMQIQTLPDGGGRILIYDGMAVTLAFDENTGMEIVRGVSVSGGMSGPRGLAVGFSVQEAAALFRCDKDVSTFGGTLYVEGEALGEAPCGMLFANGGGGMTLTYVCAAEDGREAVLEAGIQDGAVTYWRLLYRDDLESGV